MDIYDTCFQYGQIVVSNNKEVYKTTDIITAPICKSGICLCLDPVLVTVTPWTSNQWAKHPKNCTLQEMKILSELQALSSKWRHNERYGVSNLHCLLNRLFRRRSKKASKLLVTGLCEGNPPVTGGSPSQRASNAENISIWWHNHVWGKPPVTA